MDLQRIRRTSYLLFLCVWLFCPAGRAADDGRKLLSTLGFQRVNSPAVEGRAFDLDGNSVSLSEYKGDWIFLTFWATWCGPCAYELPKLESLYQEFKGKGLKVIGVSVDQGDVSGVRDFVSQKGLSFPIWHDRQGDLASKYQSSAIPTIYVISPQWEVVGVMRGAVDWEQDLAKKRVAALLKIRSLEEEVESGDDNQLQLPPDLEPPSVDLILAKQEFSLSETVVARVEIRWTGDSRRYLIKVPEVTVPEKGLKLGSMSSFSDSRAGQSVLYYEFGIEVKEPGKYHLGPVQLSFRPRGGGEEQFVRVAGLDLNFSAPKGVPVWVWVLLGVLLALACGAAFWWRQRKSASAQATKPAASWAGSYEKVRQAKVHSTRKEYVEELLGLALKVSQDKGDKDTKISVLLEKVRFGGHLPTEQEVRFYEKSLETQMASDEPL